jgi:hypothetical protein
MRGEEFAKQHGYSLHSSSGNGKSATYTKGGIFLKVYDKNGEMAGELSKMVGMVECMIRDFSIPNQNFAIFEKQLNRVGFLE